MSRGPIGNPYHFVRLYFIFSCFIPLSLTAIDSPPFIYCLETALGLKCQNVFFFFFRESDTPPSGFLISYLALHSPLSPLFLVNSLVSLSAHSPPALFLPSVELEIKPCHLPTHCTLPLCSLGNESAHYSNKYLRGVGGISQATSKTPTRTPPNPSASLVLAEVLFCLPELALMACFFAAPIACSRATFSQVQVGVCSGHAEPLIALQNCS